MNDITTPSMTADILPKAHASSTRKDMLGIVCSSLCLAHCLLLPMLLATGVLGSVGALLASEQVHLMLLVPVILLAALSFPASYKQHHSLTPIITGSLGLLSLLLALILGENFEVTLTIIGAFLLIAAHLSNRSLLTRSLLNRSLTNG
ncbi:MerC domain-containing protein [Bacterioplanoides sp.]|uniref:MerC domain-containing protein n=1 Tax=Bacterioplanoides sp. TaxID=2066072 RepID=UPI003AFFA41D